MIASRAPSFLFSPIWLTPRVVLVVAVVVAAATLGFARIDNTPGGLSTTALLLAIWLPLSFPQRRGWARRLWNTWAIGLSIAYVALFMAGDEHDLQFYVQALDGSKASCRATLHDANGLYYMLILAPRMVLFSLLAGLLVSAAAPRRAIQRELSSPCADSSDHLLLVAGLWVSLAGGVSLMDSYSRSARSLVCSAEAGPKSTQTLPRFCTPQSISHGACKNIPLPATQLTAKVLGAFVVGLGLAASAWAARRIQRRRLWIRQVSRREVPNWYFISHDPAKMSLENTPRLCRSDAFPDSDCLKLLVFSSVDSKLGGEDATQTVVGSVTHGSGMAHPVVDLRGAHHVALMLVLFAVVTSTTYFPFIYLRTLVFDRLPEYNFVHWAE